MNKIWLIILSFLIVGCFGCEHGNASEERVPVTKVTEELHAQRISDRTAIIERLRGKIERGEPLVVHVFVPLCDNVHQGIVPVNDRLGNGQNPNTNLYWGAGYGIRTFFRRKKEWEELYFEAFKQGENEVLERIVFEKKFPNKARVQLIAEAYDGGFMKQCLEDYIGSLAGLEKREVKVDSSRVISGGKDADLVVFNGHNGLMDEQPDLPSTFISRDHEAVAIACYAYDYFEEIFEMYQAYPSLCSTHLLAPEAYTLEAVINAWAQLKSDQDIRMAAARTYNQYQKCGIKGATNLFRSGWK